jgi:hypothetical protein
MELYPILLNIMPVPTLQRASSTVVLPQQEEAKPPLLLTVSYNVWIDSVEVKAYCEELPTLFYCSHRENGREFPLMRSPTDLYLIEVSVYPNYLVLFVELPESIEECRIEVNYIDGSPQVTFSNPQARRLSYEQSYPLLMEYINASRQS